ncbi:helix-turn-helix domain-containing protein [Streptomyces millisiae]|uniref:Helix-turn-helix domain-containing protein n=1 Tax=Streptomyces millisiae TaxID=3075542 RepID=A0ABU2LMQ8_9ACTN|nr:helix-turn-helix domain-containing protein [Streptomyces sp. DSM 44918]MDT0318879.1 helix-turn-helix domain-containing protein [Streptomyces sp. DSM 44918]
MRAEWAERLLREAGRQAALDAAPDVGEVLEWLGRRTGAEVALVGPGGGVEVATGGFPARLPKALGPVLGRLSGGEMAAAATEVDGVRVRCEALGPGRQRRVLVVAGAATRSGDAAWLATRAGGLIALLCRLADTEAAARAYHAKAGQVRLAVFMALMAGDPTLARRLTTGAVPPVLNAGPLRVLLLRCPPADREPLARRYQDAAGFHGRGLLVRCPVYEEHLICLVPEGDELADRLHALVAERPGYALGVSAPRPARATAEAYDQARHALAMARNTPERVAGYRGQGPLERLLPQPAARAWARAFLRPLGTVPEQTVHVTRLALSFPRAGVARLLGIGRNTVTARLGEVERALGLDLRDVGARASLALALAVAASPAGDARGSPAPTLDELLRTPAATAWATALLAPLRRPEHRELFATLRAWIDENADARRAAHRLGISRNTVRARLRVAERLLGRDLLSTGAGIHDLVHALRSTGAT